MPNNKCNVQTISTETSASPQMLRAAATDIFRGPASVNNIKKHTNKRATQKSYVCIREEEGRKLQIKIH